MAEQILGPSWTSYNQTVEHILQMEDMIHVLSPQDRPWVHGIGGEGVPLIPSKPVLNRVYYWQEEEEPQPISVIAEALDDTETDIDIPEGSGANWRVGDWANIDDEVVQITGITPGSSSPDVLTVVRGVGGSSNAAHADGSEIHGVGTVLPEGQIGSAAYFGRDSVFNYTQIFSASVEVSRTEQSIPKYGVPSELAKQTAITLKRVQLERENVAAYGLRWQETATQRRTTAGFKTRVATAANIDSSNVWMTLLRVEALLAVIHGNGGETDGCALISNEANFGALNNLVDTGRVRVTELADSRRGRMKAKVLMTEYGDVTLARNRRLKAADAFLYHPTRFTRRDFQPLIMFPLAKTGDTDKFAMVCEEGYQLKGADQAARFSALDSSQTQPTSGLV